LQASGRQLRRAKGGAALHYERHRTEQTRLYRLMQQPAAHFFEWAEAPAGSELPRFTEDELAGFFECGHDRLLAFICKLRSGPQFRVSGVRNAWQSCRRKPTLRG
jgi:hypothetical protein